jgi:CO dehydrogenase/acetyl-CoA synthase gamma subunit (corrinoid Fe-S protein)
MRFFSLLWAVKPDEILPEVEVLQLPTPGPTGLFPINQPGKDSPILVSGNSKITGEVLTAVLSTTLSPFWYLAVNTDGHTVDMAIVYKVMTAERVIQEISRENIDQIVCAAELPLFFGDENWKVA